MGSENAVPAGYHSVSGRKGFPSDWHLFEAEVTGSTNADALLAAERGAPAPSVFRSQRQTEGRGRQGRSWESPSGNLYCSVLLRPRHTLGYSLTLSFVAAIALAEAVESLDLRCPVQLKWPNDVMIGGRKLAGILLESRSRGTMCEHVVIGSGLNVANAPATSRPVAALAEFLASPLDPESIMTLYVQALDRVLRVWDSSGFHDIKDRWQSMAQGLGENVSVTCDGRVVNGTFVGLDDTGAMLVVEQSGCRADRTPTRIRVGDVIFGGAGTRAVQSE